MRGPKLNAQSGIKDTSRHHYWGVQAIAMEQRNLYSYDPSKAGIGVAVVLFAIVTAHHGWIMFRRRCWFWISFWIGGILEMLGYIVRGVSSNQTDNVGLYAIQSLFILLPPILFAASIYMTLGRLLVYIEGDFISPVRVKYVTKLFVFGDVVSFLLVAAGAGLQASADTLEKSKNGSNIVVGGLAVQLIFFSSFLFLSILCHVRLNRHSWRKTFPGKLQWPALFYALYSSCILILARSFYRVVEYSQGREGELMTTEIYMYMLDTLLMFLVMVTFSIVHPTYVIYKPDTIESYRLGDEEMK
ncbi:hypothetical protein TRICI_002325 [Trichomonascus ciferrii]|uniref:RTA1 like protein n=1 Tax=Trichomonascus ciferrii TaxID=44093 RepID=A0A6A1LUQ7_9ASCO|nr:hypothetical protein TRICI_002325 [Trichomonascus ciferrii]